MRLPSNLESGEPEVPSKSCNELPKILRPDVSVLMPVHNAAATLRASIKSTLRAMPAQSELLIYFDGCSDESYEIAKSFVDNRIRLIESAQNLGVSKALNAMLGIAKGEFVARMDADDICLPWRFRCTISKMRGNGNLDFLFSGAVKFGDLELRHFGLQMFVPLNEKQSKLALCLVNPFVHPTMICKRETLERLGGYPDSVAEDYALWLEAANAGANLRRSGIPTILYRVHPSQLTRQAKWDADVNSDWLVKSLVTDLRTSCGLPNHSEMDFGKESQIYLAATRTINLMPIFQKIQLRAYLRRAANKRSEA